MQNSVNTRKDTRENWGGGEAKYCKCEEKKETRKKMEYITGKRDPGGKERKEGRREEGKEGGRRKEDEEVCGGWGWGG